MTDVEQRSAAATFAKDWHERGNEKSDTQTFWISLLVNVLGVRANETAAFIQFEKSVERLGHAGYIDAYIPSTRVLIEQKSLGIDLGKAEAFGQARAYADNLPFSEKPRWIVVSDFATFRVHDMEKPLAPPMVIELKNLAKEAHRLKFLVDVGSSALKREEEISLAAGRIIGELYDAFLKLYGDNPSEADLRNLNVLCVRIVFCLYAEDAGILPKNAFHDYLNKFVSSDIRVAMRDFFETLNTKPEERGRFIDPDLARLPYVNGGLFGDYSPTGVKSPADFAEDADGILGDAMNRVSTVRQHSDVATRFIASPPTQCPQNTIPEESAKSARSAGGKFDIPPFSTEMRILLLQKASLNFDWSAISPTIFGAVFESTLNPETRRKGGMHYTSVENIHKVIDPLFLDALWKEFGEIVGGDRLPQISQMTQTGSSRAPRAQGNDVSNVVKNGGRDDVGNIVSLGAHGVRELPAKQSPKNPRNLRNLREKLLAFQQKLASLTFLDPACGSGNFLTETYLSLRRLENEVLKILLNGEAQFDLGDLVRVNIHQFYGIEINDFAVTVAKTALWIAESQMLKETEDILHRSLDFLPLKTYSNIVEANALTLDWESVVPRDRLSYIIGNPPFVGASMMNAEQKREAVAIFGKGARVNSIDYVGAWYHKAIALMRGTSIRAALVSTNSITQGEQVAPLWKPLFDAGLQIDFAWRTFRWDSESVGKAHVHCVIVGFRCLPQISQMTQKGSPRPPGAGCAGVGNECRDVARYVSTPVPGGHGLPANQISEKSAKSAKSAGDKLIFDEQNRPHSAANINAYLVDAPNICIESSSKSLCGMPPMTYGNKPTDGGNLILSDEEKNELLARHPEAAPLVRRYVGAKDFINNNEVRWCLWLRGISPAAYRGIPEILRRLDGVRQMRLQSSAAPTRAAADTPYLFFSAPQTDDTYLCLPEVSSERRRYIPIGFFDSRTIAANTMLIVPNATLYHFGVLTSSVHMAWMRAVGGRLKSDYRYSGSVVYNNFPWPELFPADHADCADCRDVARYVSTPTTLPNTITDKSASSAKSAGDLITQTAQAILDARARYPDASLADLYDERTMPADLRKAHQANDRAVMAAYGLIQSREQGGKGSRRENPLDPLSPETLAESEKSASSARSYPPTEQSEGVAKRCPSRGAGDKTPSESAIVAELMRRYQALSEAGAPLAHGVRLDRL